MVGGVHGAVTSLDEVDPRRAIRVAGDDVDGHTEAKEEPEWGKSWSLCGEGRD